MPRPHRRPPPQPLADCFALVRRADVHLKAIDKVFEHFLTSDAYRIVSRVDARPVEDALIDARDAGGWRATLAGPASPRDIVFTAVVRRAPPSQRAGILIGETVNSLRAALDHAIWSLSVRANHAPTDPLPKMWREVGWPVVLDSTDWPSALSSRLRFVDEPTVRKAIESWQPFSRRPEQPEQDEFAVLHELWNVHKHRHLPLTQLWIGLDHVLGRLNTVEVFDSPPGYADGLRKVLREHSLVIVSQRAPGPFEDGTELGRVREVQPPYSWLPEMTVHPQFTVDVAFNQGPPAYGASVLGALGRIRREVVDALDGLKLLI